MNLATLYARRGQPGLEQLAKASNDVVKVPYLQRLLYVLSRRPSVERAQLLISVSEKLWPGQGLTLDGLTNPVFYKDAIEAELKHGRAHESFVKKPRTKAVKQPAEAETK